MASVDRIEHQLEVATTHYERCVEKLEKFMEGEKGDRLEELKKNLREKEEVDENQRKKWIEEKQELEKQEKKLEIEKEEWKEELRKWAEKLRAAIDDTGNKFVNSTFPSIQSILLFIHFVIICVLWKEYPYLREYLVYNAYYFLFSMVILEHLAKRARLDMPDNTLSFLQLLCPPFDEPITRSNLEHCFTSALLQKLPAISHLCRDYGNYLVPIDSDPLYNVPRLLAIVTTIFSKSFTESPRQEQRTADGINNHILDMITLLGQCFATPSLRWKRNGKINDTSTITDKSVRPDITVYCNDLLVMIGEEKDIKENILNAAQQLNDYFQFWNPLAFGNLPFVLALAAGGRAAAYFPAADMGIGVKVAGLLSSTLAELQAVVLVLKTKHRAEMEKTDLVGDNGVISGLSSSVVFTLLAGVVCMFGVIESFAVKFDRHKLCHFFSGLGSDVFVSISVALSGLSGWPHVVCV
ncbi:hypothetical protein G9A89_000875 [Geosiphon pyriformis]|nr:hypothetical protein G9A89_000875 [Geosiphon pyriformis]